MKLQALIAIFLLTAGQVFAQGNTCATAELLDISALANCPIILKDFSMAGFMASGAAPLPTCGTFGAGYTDAWFQVTIPSGINSVNVGLDTDNPGDWFDGFSSRPAVAAYRGSCGSLSEVDCQETTVLAGFFYIPLSGQLIS